MDKKKKIMLICIIVAVIIVLVIASTIYRKKKSNDELLENGTTESSKVADLYNQLKDKTQYSFNFTDNDNKIVYQKSDTQTYMETVMVTSDGEKDSMKYIIKDGNTYMLYDDEKTYYTYNNNTQDSNFVLDNLNGIGSLEHTNGSEKIDGKKYKYEEYPTATAFILSEDMNSAVPDDQTSSNNNSSNVKTRFYFDGDKLVYVKTIIGDKEELVKVDESDDVDSNLFEIPTDYKDGNQEQETNQETEEQDTEENAENSQE